MGGLKTNYMIRNLAGRLKMQNYYVDIDNDNKIWNFWASNLNLSNFIVSDQSVTFVFDNGADTMRSSAAYANNDRILRQTLWNHLNSFEDGQKWVIAALLGISTSYLLCQRNKVVLLLIFMQWRTLTR